MTATDNAISAIEASVKASFDEQIATGARSMAHDPARLLRAVYGVDWPGGWPETAAGEIELLADCRSRIRALSALGNQMATHYGDVTDRLLECRKAERALVVILGGTP